MTATTLVACDRHPSMSHRYAVAERMLTLAYIVVERNARVATLDAAGRPYVPD
jgi:hypothetical protein